MSKISIILPVYNVESYLERSLQSILKQSLPLFELITVNDGSTDTSGEICEAYAQKDQRIRLIHQENQGLSMARNKGLEVATGEYVLFVDSDDYLHQDLLKVLYHNLKKHQADVSISNYELVYEGESGRETAPYENNIKVLEPIEAVKEIVQESRTQMIIAWGKLYKKSLFEEVKYPRGKVHEDEFVTYKVFYQSKRIVVTDAKLYFYWQRKESITGDSYSLKRLDKLKGLEEAIYFFEAKAEKDLAHQARARYLLNIQIGYYKVKYEMDKETKVLAALQKEYETQYKLLRNTDGKVPLFKSLMLRAFHASPKIYSLLVHLVVKSGLIF